VVELGSGAGFAHKSIEGALIVDEVFGDKFQRDMAAEAKILRFINHTHTAATELGEHAVVGYGLADDLHNYVMRTVSWVKA
jgi:hypothetical protein